MRGGLIIATEVENTDSSLQIQQNKLNSLNKKIDSLKKELEELRAKNMDLLVKKEELCNKVASQEEEIETQKELIEKLKYDISDYNKQNQILKKKVEQSAQTIEQSNKTIETLNIQLSNLEDSCHKSSQLIAKLEDKISDLKNEKILTDKFDKQTLQIIDLHSNNEKLHSNVKELNKTVEKQDGKINNQKDGISRLNVFKQDQKREIEKLKEELAKQRELIDNNDIIGPYNSILKQKLLTNDAYLDDTLKLGQVAIDIFDFLAFLSAKKSKCEEDVRTNGDFKSLMDTSTKELREGLTRSKDEVYQEFGINYTLLKNLRKLKKNRNNNNAHPDLSKSTDDEILGLSEGFKLSGVNAKNICELYIDLRNEVNNVSS